MRFLYRFLWRKFEFFFKYLHLLNKKITSLFHHLLFVPSEKNAFFFYPPSHAHCRNKFFPTKSRWQFSIQNYLCQHQWFWPATPVRCSYQHRGKNHVRTDYFWMYEQSLSTFYINQKMTLWLWKNNKKSNSYYCKRKWLSVL